MKTLPTLTLDDKYGPKIDERADIQNRTASDLLAIMRTEDDPVRYVSEFLGLTQLYSDGLAKNNGYSWDKQGKILEQWYLLGTEIIGLYYRDILNIDNFRREVLGYEEHILKYSLTGSMKIRHSCMHSDRFLNFLAVSAEVLDKEDIGIIVPIASSGFELGFLFNYFLETTSLLPVRYSYQHPSYNDEKLIIPINAPGDYLSSLEGKNVLVLDDDTLHGISFSKVVSEVAKLKPSQLIGGVAIGNLGQDVINLGFHKILCRNLIFEKTKFMDFPPSLYEIDIQEASEIVVD